MSLAADAFYLSTIIFSLLSTAALRSALVFSNFSSLSFSLSNSALYAAMFLGSDPAFYFLSSLSIIILASLLASS